MTKVCASKMMIALLSVGITGCAGSGGQTPSFTLPSLPSVGALQSAGAPPDQAPVSTPATPSAQTSVNETAAPVVTTISGPTGSATDIYSRIASGAMGCWFAVGGPLKTDYIYHATADAPSRGGKAEIVIHRRDPTQPNPRGAKAFRVNLVPSGETSATVTTENRKMPDVFAAAMTEDVGRWAKGEHGCAGSSAVAGWPPKPVAKATAAETGKTKKSKAKKKPRLKAAETKSSAPRPD